ncbi:LLM class flavin-dependent oxidoreductase [Frankia sp. QA3]|uniref:LLM class flavin-dependent oxidoreductase n=1 Tax=Frankia sp. QA3 TaxID=710111 RepID=UPI000269BF54|nr:LLM class flavin-dependent oxidoreductase [Frankia sp. QA3]EIV92417.1 flavin-dependent oxidoreductase, F420-dependent methylene-tetrahydromethanopterin reductase [Frankia sp. QA3]
MSTIVGQQLGFGTELGVGFDPDRLAEDAQHADALGYDLFSISDHLHSDQPRFEPWTALTWVAAATERIGVLPNVLGLPYRAPAVTAKMAEVLDRLSAGRLVLGLGVGGYDQEFAAFGLARRTPGQKVAALEEAVRIIRGLWTEETVTFAGEHFHTDEARIEPRPAHRIPVWLGTYGPRALRLTGALADGWIPSLPRLELAEAVAMRAAVRSSALAAGRDPDEITCACNVVVGFDERRSPTSRLVVGSSEAIAEQLVTIVRAGFTFLQALGLAEPEHRERFATEVIPLVRNELVRA